MRCVEFLRSCGYGMVCMCRKVAHFKCCMLLYAIGMGWMGCVEGVCRKVTYLRLCVVVMW